MSIYSSKNLTSLSVNNSEKLRITSGGSIGIGTTIPSGRLEVAYTSDSDGLYVTNTSRGGKWRLSTSGGGAENIDFQRYDTNNSVFRRYLILGPTLFSVYTGSTATSTQRFTIIDNGNVGIGTNSPTDKLHIYNTATTGQIRIGGGNGADNHRIYINSHPTSSYLDSFGNGVYAPFRIEAAPLLLNSLSGGNVGIGTTNPGYKFHLLGSNTIALFQSTSSYSDIRFSNSSSSNSFIGYYGTNLKFYANSTNTPTLTIAGGSPGNVGIKIESPFSSLQVGGHTFTGANGMIVNDRVGISNHGNLTGLMLASTYNDGTHPEYGLVFVQGPNTSDYNVWSISPQGPALGDKLEFIYQKNATNIHTQNPKVVFGGDGNVGIGTTNPSTKLQVEGNVYINNGSINVSKNIIEGTDNWLASSYRMDNYKTFTNGAYQNYFRFTRSSAVADNNRVGVLGGMLHIVYINDRSNSVHTTGYNCYPIVVRGRSSDTMSGTVGTAISDIDAVIGSDVQVRFISATTTTIDLQIYIYNSDGGGSEQLCHAWLDVGLSATHSDRSIIPSRL